jgi:hypothetical protein
MENLLNDREKSLLRGVLHQYAGDRQDLLEAVETNSFSREERSEVCRLISKEFVRIGLGPDDEPNAVGLELESLLDAVNRPNLGFQRGGT